MAKWCRRFCQLPGHVIPRRGGLPTLGSGVDVPDRPCYSASAHPSSFRSAAIMAVVSVSARAQGTGCRRGSEPRVQVAWLWIRAVFSIVG